MVLKAQQIDALENPMVVAERQRESDRQCGVAMRTTIDVLSRTCACRASICASGVDSASILGTKSLIRSI